MRQLPGRGLDSTDGHPVLIPDRLPTPLWPGNATTRTQDGTLCDLSCGREEESTGGHGVAGYPGARSCLHAPHDTQLHLTPHFSNNLQSNVPPPTAQALADCDPGFRPLAERDLNAAWTAIEAATVDSTARRQGWQHWTNYCRGWNCDPWLVNTHPHQKTQRLLAFAARARTGIFGKGKQVGFQSVEKALRHVAQTFVLAGYDDPRRDLGAKDLNLPFRHLLKSYRTNDPAPQPQLALPVPSDNRRGGQHLLSSARPRTRASADLVTTAFFFLLRAGEYTIPNSNKTTRTVQFRIQDVTFRRTDGTVIPNSEPCALCNPQQRGLSHAILGQPK
jgi:hypothetical protein